MRLRAGVPLPTEIAIDLADRLVRSSNGVRKRRSPLRTRPSGFVVRRQGFGILGARSWGSPSDSTRLLDALVAP